MHSLPYELLIGTNESHVAIVDGRRRIRCHGRRKGPDKARNVTAVNMSLSESRRECPKCGANHETRAVQAALSLS